MPSTCRLFLCVLLITTAACGDDSGDTGDAVADTAADAGTDVAPDTDEPDTDVAPDTDEPDTDIAPDTGDGADTPTETDTGCEEGSEGCACGGGCESGLVCDGVTASCRGPITCGGLRPPCSESGRQCVASAGVDAECGDCAAGLVPNVAGDLSQGCNVPDCDGSSCYQCADGSEVEGVACDGTNDCSDGSDEAGCISCGNAGTSVQGAVCNGVTECAGGQDEQGCITCEDGDVVDGVECDNTVDCADGSDEGNCIFCIDGPIVNGHFCDGVNDCSSGSDEFGCFNCADSGESATPCDGVADCADGSDEPRLCICDSSTLVQCNSRHSGTLVGADNDVTATACGQPGSNHAGNDVALDLPGGLSGDDGARLPLARAPVAGVRQRGRARR